MAISRNDRAATTDAFGLSPYIDGLSRFIRDCEPPMTIAIQGSWGSGKTSLMQMVSRQLEQTAVCVSFNTWQYSQFNLGDNLPAVFYRALIEKLDADTGGKARELGELADACAKALRAAVCFGAGLAGVGEAASSALKELDSKQTPVSLVRTMEELRQSFQDLVAKRCTRGKDRVVFFIDDLDRLPPERALELMEVLKVILECDKCVFVLAIDYDVVVRGIRAKYGEDLGDSKAHSFFDKLIQLPFTLPVAQYQIQDYVRSLFDGLGDPRCRELFPDEGLLLAQEAIRLTVGHNPRGIKRLFNTFSLCLCTCPDLDISPRVLETVFLVQCLQMGFPSIHDAFRQAAPHSIALDRFLGWFWGGAPDPEDPEAPELPHQSLEDAVREDAALAQSLALGSMDPVQRKSLNQFMSLLRGYLSRWDTIVPDPFFPDWEPAIPKEGLLFNLPQWELLQDALDLSAAAALGSAPGSRTRRIPPEEKRSAMSLLVSTVIDDYILSSDSDPGPILRASARTSVAEQLDRRGIYVRESAIMALYTINLAGTPIWDGRNFFRYAYEMDAQSMRADEYYLSPEDAKTPKQARRAALWDAIYEGYRYRIGDYQYPDATPEEEADYFRQLSEDRPPAPDLDDEEA